MSEKRLNNTIYIMYLVTENYKKLYHGTAEKFETIDVFKGRNNKDF